MRAPTAILAPSMSTKHWKPACPAWGCGRFSASRTNSRATPLGTRTSWTSAGRRSRGQYPAPCVLRWAGFYTFVTKRKHCSFITIYFFTVGCVSNYLTFSPLTTVRWHVLALCVHRFSWTHQLHAHWALTHEEQVVCREQSKYAKFLLTKSLFVSDERTFKK